MKRPDGELILFWTLPVLAVLWIVAYFMFPGFINVMSPTMSADEVAAFYLDPSHLSRIRYSMILFNWFCFGMIVMLALLIMQVRRMAHRTPIFKYSMIACAAGGPTVFLIANLFWLLAAFRPERSPALTQLLNDLGWVTFTSAVPPFLIAQCVILALAIYFDDRDHPVFDRWVAPFNLLVAVVLVPSTFAGLTLEGPVAWDGLLSFWVKNVAIALWLAVTAVVLGRNIYRQRAEAEPRPVDAGAPA